MSNKLPRKSVSWLTAASNASLTGLAEQTAGNNPSADTPVVTKAGIPLSGAMAMSARNLLFPSLFSVPVHELLLPSGRWLDSLHVILSPEIEGVFFPLDEFQDMLHPVLYLVSSEYSLSARTLPKLPREACSRN